MNKKKQSVQSAQNSQNPPKTGDVGASSANTVEQKFIHFIETKVTPYWRQIIWATLIIGLLAVLGVRLVIQRETEKAVAFGRLDHAESIEELRLLAEEFQGDKIAAMALLRQGRLLLQEEEDYAEAENVFSQVLEDFNDPEYRLPALLGQAYAREAQENYDRALTDFEMIAEQADEDDLTVLIIAWSGVGRNAAAVGREEKARQALNKVKENAEHGPYFEQAERLLIELESESDAIQ